jgi:hypothetical protein
MIQLSKVSHSEKSSSESVTMLSLSDELSVSVALADSVHPDSDSHVDVLAELESILRFLRL